MTQQNKIKSACCDAPLSGSLGDGVLIGSCSKCYQNQTRVNPRTGTVEWLDGKSPWSEGDLRHVEGLTGGTR